ncbi:type II toxin-antitoxin system antitoxin SocA domain-containing protein [Spiroplasma endosymbiont of Ammophila pubescens]|uniref:type II toxin-antitoxin system antitoxin SocA domain-containing protein n=1 Tax=Spiroplasma endosymbiont of Ammophila pubescens TaxID=3066315 RepID=UPI0032B224E1
MEKYGAKNISNYILKYFYDKECTTDEFAMFLLEINNLKMQKILYFLFGFYFSETKQELFPKDFYAWKYGPVIQKLYYFNKEKVEQSGEINLPKDAYSKYMYENPNINFIIIDKILSNIL